MKKPNFNNIDNILWEGIDPKDSPEYSDAFITYAEQDGQPMSENDLGILNLHLDIFYDNLIQSMI